MDGGLRQEEMANRLKLEIKEKARRRRGERTFHITDNRISVAEATTDEFTELPHKIRMDLAPPPRNLINTTSYIHNNGIEPRPEASTISIQRGADSTLTSKDARESVAFGQSDAILLMFYLEHLHPFLFPFYRPSLSQGGRAWILELTMSSPAVRQATLCQSSHFFSLAQGTANRRVAWEAALA
jgi:hypothetical protein